MLGGLGASFLASFDLLLVVTALPSAARDLGGIGGYAFAAAAYAVAQVTGQPIGGALSDRAGPVAHAARRLGGLRGRHRDRRLGDVARP